MPNTRKMEDMILAMTLRGASFVEVENFIEGLPVDDERKATLWLLAWGERGRGERRRILLSV